MNTEDYKPLPLPDGNIFEYMMREQRDLMMKFFKAEGVDPGRIDDFNINFYDDQVLFKDFAQIRICEELCEAIEACDDSNHLREEVIDAFNFFLELCIIYRYDVKKLSYKSRLLLYRGGLHLYDVIVDHINDAIYMIHMMCNKLKSRPWKSTQYLVDMKVFEYRFDAFIEYMFSIIRACFVSEIDLFNEWSKKYQVNKFRIESNY